MKPKAWRFCSQEEDTISLHDCVMDRLEWAKEGVWLIFGEGFYVTKDNSLNPTGRHRLTGKAAVLLNGGAYLDGAWNRGCTWQGPDDPQPVPLQELPIQLEQLAKLSPEVLDFTWEPENKRFSLDGVGSEGYCTFVFDCEEVWFCWDKLPQDAWFQDWPRK